MNNFGIDKSWIDAGLDINLIRHIMLQIEEKRKNVQILPDQENILNSIKLCPLDNVKVLIIGQDPYPSPEHAHGLAFSSLSDRTPASLKNIFKKLKQDFPNCKHSTNLLLSWEKQGVLLLNTALTFEGKDPKLLKEHTNLWKPVIENIFSILKNRGNLIVMRWGSHAQKAGECFEGVKSIVIMDTTHPSPFSAHKGFMTSDHFTKCNQILKDKAICWDT
ncbi:MAG: uracil-DNA glycosylase [bacterium]|nr:uracil-DNA glycosylase [bacterium]